MTDTTVITPAEPESNGGGRRAKVIGVGLGAAALVLGGGAFAYSQLSGGGPQPADVLPASTDAYVRLDLDPSASQKVELFRLLRKVPEVGEALGIEDPNRDDLRRLVFEGITEDACEDLDYDQDVEPWLGDRLGMGLDGERILIAAQVDDEPAAKKGVAAVFSCLDEEYALDFAEGYALISNEKSSIDAALKAVEDGKTLAASDAFTSDMTALGDQGVASVWIDPAGFVDTFGEEIDEATRTELEQAGTVALTLRADGSALELAGVGKAPKDGMDAAPIGDLPADTVFALSVAGAGEQVSKQWAQFEDAFSAGFGELESGLEEVEGVTPTEPFPTVDPDILEGMDPETRQMFEDLQEDYGTPTDGTDPIAPGEPSGDPIQSFEDATGLTLPDDLSTLLGTTVTLAVGAENIDTIPESSGPGDLAGLDIGLRTTGDPADTKAVFDKLVTLAADNELELFAESTKDGAVLATNADAAQALTGGGKLGSSDAFEAAMPFGDDTVGGLFVDVSTIIDKILEADPPDDVRQDLEDAKTIDAVGISAAVDGDHTRFSLRAVFAD